MATILLQATGLRTTGEVTRFVEIAQLLGITGARAYPLLNGSDGISVMVSVPLDTIRAGD